MLSITIKTLRGSHIMITLLYFVPFVWIVSITGMLINSMLSGYITV